MSAPAKTGAWKRSAQAEDHLLVLKLREIGEWKQLTAEHSTLSADLVTKTEEWSAGQEKNSPAADRQFLNETHTIHSLLIRVSSRIAELIEHYDALCRLCWHARATGTRIWEGARTRVCRRCAQIREPGQGADR